jgi:hypothetical protein
MGLVAGVVGGGSVALWFLIVDIVAGRPLFTPAVLGAAVFFGLRDPAALTISSNAIVAYTVLHFLAFLVVGVIISAVLTEITKTPHVLWLLVEFFVVFEFGFYAAVALFFAPLLEELAWINVAVGNLIAAGTLGYYFWRVHPVFRARRDNR